MSSAIVRLKEITTKYPLLRGVLSYSIIWPTSALIQQRMAGKTLDTYDWGRCIRFSIYGAFYVAPTLYAWIRLSTMLFPKNNFKSAISKVGFVDPIKWIFCIENKDFVCSQALVEQVSYTPAAMTSFYFFMSLLEGKSTEAAKAEVQNKFLPTYKVRLASYFVMNESFIFQPSVISCRRPCVCGPLYRRWISHWYLNVIVCHSSVCAACCGHAF